MIRQSLFLYLAFLFFLVNGCSLGDPQAPLENEIPQTNPMGPETSNTPGSVNNERSNSTPSTKFANEVSVGESLEPSINIENQKFLDRVEQIESLTQSLTLPYFIEIVRLDKVPLMKMFLVNDQNYPVDKKIESSGKTLLHFAQSFEMAELIGMHKINTGKRRRGRTREFIQVFQSAIDVADDNGDLPAHQMASTGAIGSLQWVLEKSCNWVYSDRLNQTNKQKKTPLHLAATSGDALLVRQLLLCSHVNVNQLDDQGYTAFHHALLQDDFTVAYIFLEQREPKVLLTFKSFTGETAVQIAKKASSKKLIKLLESY